MAYYSTSAWLDAAVHAINDISNSYDFQSEYEAQIDLRVALYELEQRKLACSVDEAIAIRRNRLHRDATEPIVRKNKWGIEYLSKKDGCSWYDWYHGCLVEGACALPF